jgi:hypothetical protein
MSVHFGSRFVSAFARDLWAEVGKPRAKLDRQEIHLLASNYGLLLEVAIDDAGLWFGVESHEVKPPPIVGRHRPHCWHEVPYEVAIAAERVRDDSEWRHETAHLVAKFSGLESKLDSELERFEKRLRRPRPLRAVELIYEGATDEAAAAELGLTPRALRGSLAWKRLRAALAAVELASRPERPRPRTSGRGSNPGKVARRGASKA